MTWEEVLIIAPVVLILALMCYIDCCRKPDKAEEDKD
jgi:hypothetical protein